MGQSNFRGIVRSGALHGIFEAPNPFGQPLSKLRQLPRAEHQESDSENNQQMPGLEQIFKHGSTSTHHSILCTPYSEVLLRTLPALALPSAILVQ